MLAWWAYYAGFVASRWQATPGKRAFGIKVTDLAGGRIGLPRATGRYLATIVSFLALCIGFLMPLWTKKRQALHDMIAGTLVVDAQVAPGVTPQDRRVMPLPGKVAGATAVLVVLTMVVTYVGVAIQPEENLQPEERIPAGPASSATRELSYVLYERPIFQQWKLVREGRRTYTLADVLVSPGPSADRENSVKRLDVVEGFAIKAHIYREPSISGFGLTLDKDHGFSWDWYQHERDNVFKKLQGGGRIQVRLEAGKDGLVEVAEILFLDDSTLRLDRRFMIPFTGDESDRLVVKKGSVLILK